MIGDLTVNLQFDSADDIAEGKQWVMEFCRQQLPDELAKLLKDVLQDYRGEPIAELILDLGDIRLKDLRHDFPQRLLQQITAQLSALVAGVHDKGRSGEYRSPEPGADLRQGLARFRTALKLNEGDSDPDISADPNTPAKKNVPEQNRSLVNALRESLNATLFLDWLFDKDHQTELQPELLKHWLQCLPDEQLRYLKLVLLPQLTRSDVMPHLVRRLPSSVLFQLVASLFNIELLLLQQAYQQLDSLNIEGESHPDETRPKTLSAGLLIKLCDMLAKERWQWLDKQKYSRLARPPGEAPVYQRVNGYLIGGWQGQDDAGDFTGQFNRDLRHLCSYGGAWLRLHLLPLLQVTDALNRLLQLATPDTLLELLKVIAPQEITRLASNDAGQINDTAKLASVFSQLGSGSVADKGVQEQELNLKLTPDVAALTEVRQHGQQFMTQLQALQRRIVDCAEAMNTSTANVPQSHLQQLRQSFGQALQHLQTLQWPRSIVAARNLQREMEAILSYPRQVLLGGQADLDKPVSKQQLLLFRRQMDRLIELLQLFVTRIEHADVSLCHADWGAKTQALLASVQGDAALRRRLQSGLLAWDRGVARVQEKTQSDTRPGNKTAEISDDPTDAIVDNEPVGAAGCVLLWPYLERFFDYVGYLEPKTAAISKRMFVEGKAHCGVQLLHYLVFGEVNDGMQPLPLLNLLCGLPVTELPAQGLTFDPQERHQCQQLLKSFQSHWPLPEHLPDHLIHQTFLQRQGRLVEYQNHWHLLPEPSLQDTLLSTLPWTVSNVKLPWMPSYLTVDWSTYD